MDRARAELLLIAGGDDEMWPSLPFAEQLAERRRSAGASVRLIARDDAGHRPRLPGESPAPTSPRFRYGGTPEADALLGAAAWPHILDALRRAGGQPTASPAPGSRTMNTSTGSSVSIRNPWRS